MENFEKNKSSEPAEKKSSDKISRRGFLKAIGIGAAGLAAGPVLRDRAESIFNQESLEKKIAEHRAWLLGNYGLEVSHKLTEKMKKLLTAGELTHTAYERGLSMLRKEISNYPPIFIKQSVHKAVLGSNVHEKKEPTIGLKKG